jgi:hypothetical protein
MESLGRSLRDEKVKTEHVRTVTLRHMVDEVVAYMHQSGARPRGGIREAAIAKVARSVRMDADSLRKRFQRLKD